MHTSQLLKMYSFKTHQCYICLQVNRSTFIVHRQYLSSHGIIVQRLLEQGTVHNIIQCIDLFQIAFVQEEGTIIRITSSCYMLKQSKASNKYYYYHSVIQQRVLLQDVTNPFCVYINLKFRKYN